MDTIFSTCTILKAILYYLYSNYIMTPNVSLNIICLFGGWMETSKCTKSTCIPLCINVMSKYATDCKRMHRCVKKKKKTPINCHLTRNKKVHCILCILKSEKKVFFNDTRSTHYVTCAILDWSDELFYCVYVCLFTVGM